MNVVEYIPYGHEHPISREELIRMTGVVDRNIRDAIRAARLEGQMIISTADGYFRYRDEDDLPELRSYYMKERARTFSCLENLNMLKTFLEEHGDRNQITLGELGLG
jgi:hypothetical protein